ncbi:MAG: hypothetical protein ACOC2T_03065, partial [Planctomycetota bacterium]
SYSRSPMVPILPRYRNLDATELMLYSLGSNQMELAGQRELEIPLRTGWPRPRIRKMGYLHSFEEGRSFC